MTFVKFIEKLAGEKCEIEAPGQRVDCETALARPVNEWGNYFAGIGEDVRGNRGAGYIMARCHTCEARKVLRESSGAKETNNECAHS